MMTSSNGNISRVTGHLCWEFTGQQWIRRTKASDAELWCFLWSVQLSKQFCGEAGDLRRNRAHYDVTVMLKLFPTRLYWARFLSLARSKLSLCSANHRPGYWSNLPCGWPSTAWVYSEQETEKGPWCVTGNHTVPEYEAPGGPVCIQLCMALQIYLNWSLHIFKWIKHIFRYI